MRKACNNEIIGRETSPRVASIFSGIGGFEKGLARSGFVVESFCENNSDAQRVLRHHFGDVKIRLDVRNMKRLASDVQLVTAGFPCQDLSQAGGTAGIFGGNSGLVWEVFRLIEKSRPPTILFENVPFMLRLQAGAAIEAIVERLEAADYRWAYRIIDAKAFGLPQRRPRVFLLASRTGNPANVLFADDAELQTQQTQNPSSFGFYWTEGNRGIGWAVNSLPALKGGSALGIPSPPALILPNGEIVTPHICDAERMQGFPPGWTKPAIAGQNREGVRWRLVGNAVNVRVATWIGRRLRCHTTFDHSVCDALKAPPWPDAALNVDGTRRRVEKNAYPILRKSQSADEFLQFKPKLLSFKASSGVLKRLRSSALKPAPILMQSLAQHVEKMRPVFEQ